MFLIMDHHIQCYCNSQYKNIVLTRGNLNAISIPYPEEFLGYTSNIPATFSDAVIEIKNIAFYIQVGAIIDLEKNEAPKVNLLYPDTPQS